MKNTQTIPENEQGLEFWENEADYLWRAMDGLRTSYAVLQSLHKHAQLKMDELTPSREEVES